jgi:thiamine-phosphate diphosphorylase
MRPTICLISDRRRWGNGLEADFLARVAVAARAGIGLVQIRETDLEGGELARLVRECVAAVTGTRARVIVNDRLDVALTAGAHGVHLPANGPEALRVRTLVPPGFLVGRSVHSLAEVREVSSRGGLDYLIFGTVFETRSKPDQAPCGIDTLAEAAACTAIPLLAVGGITLDRVRAVAGTGAYGLAAIGLFSDGEVGEIPGATAAICRMFDSHRVNS